MVIIAHIQKNDPSILNIRSLKKKINRERIIKPEYKSMKAHGKKKVWHSIKVIA